MYLVRAGARLTKYCSSCSLCALGYGMSPARGSTQLICSPLTAKHSANMSEMEPLQYHHRLVLDPTKSRPTEDFREEICTSTIQPKSRAWPSEKPTPSLH